jgi:heat shock protein HslJ
VRPFCVLIAGYWLAAASCALAADLLHTSWLVKEVGGHQTVGSLRPTIEFNDDGQTSGRAGCNDWNASSQIDSSKLSFGPVVTTRMACVPTMMNEQERYFFLALAATKAFRISADDSLILLDAYNKNLMRASRK